MNSNDTELLPCPFCGSPAELRATWYDGDDKMDAQMFYVDCHLCPIKTYLQDSSEAAISVWNTRTEHPRTADSNDTEAMVKAARVWLERKGYIGANENEKARLMTAFAQQQITEQTRQLAERLADAEAVIEEQRTMFDIVGVITLFFPGEIEGRGTNASISRVREGYEYHLSGELPGIASTLMDAWRELVQQAKYAGTQERE